MKTLISIIFGERDNTVGWISEEELPGVPLIGMPVVIQLDDESPAFEGQVYRAWERDDEEDVNGGMLIYGGAELPDVEFREKFELAGWELLGEDALKILSDAIEHTPAMAATHEVLLVVGSPEDEKNMRAFQRQLIPYDPALPLFGQRIRIEVSSIDKVVEFATKEEWYAHKAQEAKEVNSELSDIHSIDGLKNGLPAIVIYSSLVRNGFGKVVFWCPDLGNLHSEHLLVHDWEPLSNFDASEFKTKERITLALDSELEFEMSDYGTAEMRDWSILHPLDVPESSYELLPRLLLEGVKAAKEFENIDDIIGKWAEEENK